MNRKLRIFVILGIVLATLAAILGGSVFVYQMLHQTSNSPAALPAAPAKADSSGSSGNAVPKVATGLKNNGFTCFANATLQAIYYSETLKNAFLADLSPEDLANLDDVQSEIHEAVQNVFKELGYVNEVEQCAKEYLDSIMATLPRSFIHNTLVHANPETASYGIRISKENIGHGVNSVEQVLQSMNLPAKPPILVVNILRNDSAARWNESIPISMTVKLSTGDNSFNIYRLRSLVVHTGGVSGGHYFAYARNADDRWLKLNDSVVTYSSEDEVLNESQNTYLMFYEAEGFIEK